jgi:hypothetical protein
MPPGRGTFLTEYCAQNQLPDPGRKWLRSPTNNAGDPAANPVRRGGDDEFYHGATLSC